MMSVHPRHVDVAIVPGDDHTFRFVFKDSRGTPAVVPIEAVYIEASMRRSTRHSDEDRETTILGVTRTDDPTFVDVTFPSEGTRHLEFGRMEYSIVVVDTAGGAPKRTTAVRGIVHPRK